MKFGFGWPSGSEEKKIFENGGRTMDDNDGRMDAGAWVSTISSPCEPIALVS